MVVAPIFDVTVQSTVIELPPSCILTALAPLALLIVTSPISTPELAWLVDCTANVPALVTACDGTEARDTGSVAIAAAPSDNRTNTGVATGASTVSEPELSVTGKVELDTDTVPSTVILFHPSWILTALPPEALLIVTSPISTPLLARLVTEPDIGCVACQNVQVTGVLGIVAIDTGCVVTAGSTIISSLSELLNEAVFVSYVSVSTLPARVHQYQFLVGS